jgi:hypothetical protein
VTTATATKATEPDEPDEKDREIERLRSEVAVLSDILDGVQGECCTLHSIVSSLVGGRGVPAARTLVQVGSRERMAMLENAVAVLDDFVRESARCDCYSECEDTDCPKCTACRAREIVEAISAWRFGGSTEVPSRRFVGSMHYRTENGWNPREAKIHRAWAKYMGRWGATPDHLLGQILTDRSPGQPDGIRDWPTARDWFVATSVVQWLVTNCGSSILEQAGWRYTQWKEDEAQIREQREALR